MQYHTARQPRTVADATGPNRTEACVPCDAVRLLADSFAFFAVRGEDLSIVGQLEEKLLHPSDSVIRRILRRQMHHGRQIEGVRPPPREAFVRCVLRHYLRPNLGQPCCHNAAASIIVLQLLRDLLQCTADCLVLRICHGNVAQRCPLCQQCFQDFVLLQCELAAVCLDAPQPILQ